jgi:Suppressor of fused protein (SUFU)
MLAYYHAGPEQQRLDIGHTVPIGEPWVPGSLCDGALISLPYAYGPDLEVCEWNSGHVRVLNALPITAAERAFKISHGLEELEQRLEHAGADFANPMRPSVV